MAKNKQDYYNDGVKLAQSFIAAGRMFPESEGKPVSDLHGKPLPSWQGNWQAVALWAGFDDTRTNYYAAKTAQKESDSLKSLFPKVSYAGFRVVNSQRRRTLKKRGIVCQFLYNTVNGKAMYGWNPKDYTK